MPDSDLTGALFDADLGDFVIHRFLEAVAGGTKQPQDSRADAIDPSAEAADPADRISVGAWLAFWFAFAALATFDLFVLAPQNTGAAMPGRTAMFHVMLWFLIGLAFNIFVLIAYGFDNGEAWFNGYIMEFMLSLDNVFLFHVIFRTYCTPESQIYKALFLGICGAVFLRLLFYLLLSGFFRLWWPIPVFFGLVLIYSGYKTAVDEDDEEDPRDKWYVQCLTKYLPLSQAYDDEGRLFIHGGEHDVSGKSLHGARDLAAVGDGGDAKELRFNGSSEPNGHDLESGTKSFRTKGTLLLLVVLVLQIIDLIFAVDSVTAKISISKDIYLNFTSSAFAMLCLRSMYFVLIDLMKYFWALKYGVSIILILVGVKVGISHWVDISAHVSTAVILTIFVGSSIYSVIKPAPPEKEEADGQGEAQNPDRDTTVATRSSEVSPESLGNPSFGEKATAVAAI